MLHNNCSGRYISLLASLAVSASVGCGQSVSEHESFQSDRIIGGFPGRGPEFDAFGALGVPLNSPLLTESPESGIAASLQARPYVHTVPLMDGDETHFPFCSGTLIAPNAVLTAEHCVEFLSGDEEFLIGFDGTMPSRSVRIAGVVSEDSIPGGFIGRGSDVAVAILEEPIDDIVPIAYGALSETDIGLPYIGVGYGIRNNNEDAGQRYLGQMNLRGIGGNHAINIWETFEEYAVQFPELGFGGTPEEFLPLFDLLDEYEASFGNAPGNAQACFGDSGGPIARAVGGELIVFGVTSGGVGTFDLICDWGGVYATLGPVALEMIDRTVGCGLVPEEGVCNGVGVVQRCVPPIEGGYDVVETNCSLFGLVCGEDELGTLTCISDPCEGLPDEGVCDGEVAIECSEPGEGPRQLLETDCAVLGGTCGFDEAGDVTCVGTTSGSCQGNCGGASSGPNGICYCDDICAELGDCCADYFDVCELPGGSDEGGTDDGGEDGSDGGASGTGEGGTDDGSVSAGGSEDGGVTTIAL